MANLFKRKRTVTGPDGEKTVRLSKKWWGLFQDENGDEKRVPLSANKSVAQQMLAREIERVQRKKGGTYHPAEEQVRKPLTEHLADYLAEKKSQGNPEAHVRQVGQRVRAVLDGCKFAFPADIKAETVFTFLAELRKD